MPGRIHILIGAHLSTAPRAQKEALALTDAGYEVEISGVWFDEEAAAADEALFARTGLRLRPALDFRGGTPARWLHRTRVRLEARWARGRFRRTRLFSPRLLGYGAPELLDRAVQVEADLTIVHSEAGLWVAGELLKRGRRVGLDFEDWFSRDLPEHARRVRPVAEIERLERTVARAAKYVLAPSGAMSRALAETFSIPAPAVVYNAFPWSGRATMDGQRKDRREAEIPSLHWFSQTIGPDRGLELLLAALPLLRNSARLFLRGACSAATRRWLERLIAPAWKERVVVLPLVSNEELLSRVAEHDIGFALESDSIPSRDLSASNKLFHYLQAGLAVIATPTRGQREVLGRCGEAGTILMPANPEALPAAIDRYLKEPALLARARRDALNAARGLFAWENHQGQIVAEAERAMSS